MLKRINFPIIIAFLIFFNIASAFEKNILLENFWSHSNYVCGTSWPYFHEWYSSEPQKENSIIITYHDDASQDPWAAFSNHHQARTDYYYVSYLPICFFDGYLNCHTADTLWIQDNFVSRQSISSPLQLAVYSFVTEDNQVYANVLIETDNHVLEGNYKLRCALLSNYNDTGFYLPNNGQTEFEYDLLEFSPDAAGISLDLGTNSVNEFSFSFDWPIILEGDSQDLELEESDVTVVAFVQNDTYQEVINSDWAPLGNAQYYVDLPAEDYLINKGENITFDFDIANLLNENIQLDFTFEANFPQGWSFEFSTPDGTQNGDYSFFLEADSEYESTLTIITDEDMRFTDGWLTINYSTPEAELAFQKEIYVVMCDEVFHINAVPGANYETIYANAFANLTEINDYNISCWDLNEAPLEYEAVFELNPDILIWSAGESTRLSDVEVNFLEEYLLDGGSLWLNGSNVARGIRHTTLTEMMGAEYQGVYESQPTVFGVEDDPYFSGIETEIHGGDGVNNAGTPTMLREEGGETCLRFNLVRRCGVRNETDTYKSLLFSFPFESIADEDSRIDVMSAAISFLSNFETNIENEATITPHNFVLEQNYPNPFNPNTKISFSIPEKSDVSLIIYDINGREITSLVNAELNSGRHTFNWNASNFASGIYFCKIHANSGENVFSQIRKMILMK